MQKYILKSTSKFWSFIVFTDYICTYPEVLLNDFHPMPDVYINNGLILKLIFRIFRFLHLLCIVYLKYIPILFHLFLVADVLKGQWIWGLSDWKQPRTVDQKEAQSEDHEKRHQMKVVMISVKISHQFFQAVQRACSQRKPVLEAKE